MYSVGIIYLPWMDYIFHFKERNKLKWVQPGPFCPPECSLLFSFLKTLPIPPKPHFTPPPAQELRRRPRFVSPAASTAGAGGTPRRLCSPSAADLSQLQSSPGSPKVWCPGLLGEICRFFFVWNQKFAELGKTAICDLFLGTASDFSREMRDFWLCLGKDFDLSNPDTFVYGCW